MNTTPRSKKQSVSPVNKLAVKVDPTKNEFVGSGKVNVPYIKELLKERLPIQAEYMYSVYPLPATCSAMEITTSGSLVMMARILVKGKIVGLRKMCVANSTNSDASDKLKLLGFKEVLSYMGNHGSMVTTFVCDLSGINFPYEPIVENDINIA